MKFLSKGLILGLSMSLLAGIAAPVLAYSPVLSASSQGNGYVQITVSNANPYSEVDLYQRQTSSLWTVVSNFGQTDGNGNFSQSLSIPGDGSSNPIQIYVLVGGQQSTTVSVYPNGSNNNCGTYGNCNGCSYGCGSPTGLSLSQNSLSLGIGQTSTVTANVYNYSYSNNIYVSSNSNPSVATVTVSGSLLTVYGQTSGSSSITVCQSGNTSQCATLYVTVGNTCYSSYGCSTGNITLSQTSLNLTSGQSSAISIYNNNSGNNFYYGSYYISSNSNSGVATASVNGSTVNVYAQSSGNTTILVCQSGSTSGCASLYVTVNGNNGNCSYYNSCGGSISLSQSNVSLNVGQSQSVTAYNSNGGTLYVSSNSNSSIVTVSISGSVINLYGLTNGTSTISLCSNGSNQCATLYVTVGGGCNGYYGCNGSGNNTVSITDNAYSPQNITVPVGSTVYWMNNGSRTHTVTSDNSSFASGGIVPGQGFTYTFNTPGSFPYHDIYYGGVGGSGMSGVVIVSNSGSGYGNSLSLSQSSLNMNVSQTSTVAIYGTGGFYVSSNSNSGVANATVAGTTLYVNSLSAGNATISVCQALGSSNCVSLYVTVSGYGNNSGSSVWFSQSSVNLNVGQTQTITIYSNNYGSGYYLSGGSYSGIVNANVVGNQLNLYGQGAGSSTISVCQSSGGSNCGSVYVSVGGYNNNGGSGCYYNCYTGSGVLSLSQSNINLYQGQSATINVYGSGNYYVSSNSNSAVASGSLNGSQINLYAGQNGSTTMSICQTNGGCVSLYVTVGGSQYTGGGSGVQYPGGGSVLGSSTYTSGTLISVNGTVYIVYQGQETAFANSGAFIGLGFNYGNAVVATVSLPSTGYTVKTSNVQHPWGSWIKDGGSTVYFVQQYGLIPVPNWTTFLANGAQQTMIVPANSHDLTLPILSPMVNSDPRVQ